MVPPRGLPAHRYSGHSGAILGQVGPTWAAAEAVGVAGGALVAAAGEAEALDHGTVRSGSMASTRHAGQPRDEIGGSPGHPSVTDRTTNVPCTGALGSTESISLMPPASTCRALPRSDRGSGLGVGVLEPDPYSASIAGAVAPSPSQSLLPQLEPSGARTSPPFEPASSRSRA